MATHIPVNKINIPIVLAAVMIIAVAGATWTTSKFVMSRSAATTEHAAMITQITRESSKAHLKIKIDNSKAEMKWMESRGIKTDAERSHYDLLVYSVQHMTVRLDVLD